LTHHNQGEIIMKGNVYITICHWSFVVPLLFLIVPISAHSSLLDGLVTYYSFDGNADDLSGNGNDGTVIGAVLTTDRFDNPNSAYSFNGNGDFILASADVLPAAERTVAFWFNADSVATQPIFMGYGGGTCGTSWYMGLNISSVSTYHQSSHCNTSALDYQYQQAPIGEWKHYAISTSADGTVMYVDGVEVSSNSAFINFTNVAGTDLAVGVATSPSGFAPYTDANVGYFDGALDDLRIYDRALLASEVEQLASVPIPPALWLFGSGVLGLIGIARRRKTT
jgi:hypothetical protein